MCKTHHQVRIIISIHSIDYLFKIGIPSIVSAAKSEIISGEDINNPYKITTHDVSWPERDANRLAAQYFSRKGVDWSNNYRYPIDYPQISTPYDFSYLYPYNSPKSRRNYRH